MDIVFLSRSMTFSGGRKLLFEYADYLKNSGHNVKVLVTEDEGKLKQLTDTELVADFSPAKIPDCDLIIASTYRDILSACKSGKGKVIHFCQGYEIATLEQRLNSLSLPSKYQGNTLIDKLLLYRKKQSWKKRIKKIDSVYRLPTHKVTVSKHLKKHLEERYGTDVYLCLNGIRKDVFHPGGRAIPIEFTDTDPMRIINIGSSSISVKGIGDTTRAVAKLKAEGLSIHYTRISPESCEEEKQNPVVDEFYTDINQDELAEFYRGSDVFISNSHEGEGFGLPAMEALSSGLLCILSSISSYMNFSNIEDYCIFVPESDWKSTAESIEKIFLMSSEERMKMRDLALQASRPYSFENSCRNFENILFSINESDIGTQ